MLHLAPGDLDKVIPVSTPATVLAHERTFVFDEISVPADIGP